MSMNQTLFFFVVCLQIWIAQSSSLPVPDECNAVLGMNVGWTGSETVTPGIADVGECCAICQSQANNDPPCVAFVFNSDGHCFQKYDTGEYDIALLSGEDDVWAGIIAKQDCVGSWIGFGACSMSCGNGYQRTIYSITTEALNGGATCPHPHGTTGTRICNESPCSSNGNFRYDEYRGQMCRGTDGTATFWGRMSQSECMARCNAEESCAAFDIDEDSSCFLHQTDDPFPVPDSSHTTCFIKQRNICCEAYTLSCQACAENMTEEEYCENFSESDLCHETCQETCPYGYDLYSDYSNVCVNERWNYCAICHTNGLPWKSMDLCSELNTTTTTNSPAESFFTASGNGCKVVGNCVQTVDFPHWVQTHNECSIQMNRDAFITYNTTTGTENRDFDHLSGHIFFNAEMRLKMPVELRTGDNIFWSSNESLEIPGWQLCFSDSVITVINASWSHEIADCWSNQTLNLRNSCNATAACAHTLTGNEDPCPNQNKTYFAQYTCDGSENNLREVNVTSVAAGSTITLDCTDTCDCDCHQGYVPDTRQLPASMCWLNAMGYEKPCCNASAPSKSPTPSYQFESSSSSLALFLTTLMVLSF